MLSLQNLRQEVIIRQTAATNGETLTSDYVDTRGYGELLLTLIGTTSNNATNNPATLRVTESNDTVVTNFAAVTPLVGDTAFTIPASPTATTTAPFAQFHVDLRGRKRYLKVEVSPVTTQTFTVLATLGRAEQLPVGTTQQNAAVVVAA